MSSGSPQEKLYAKWKQEDEGEKKLKELWVMAQEKKTKKDLPLQKPKKVSHKQGVYKRSLKKEYAQELANLLDCKLDDLKGNWVQVSMPFLKIIVEQVKKKIGKAKKWA